MLNLFTASDAFQNARLLIRAIRRYHDHDRFADDLFGRIAEQFLGAFVSTHDDAVQILADDGVVQHSTMAASWPMASSACFCSVKSMNELSMCGRPAAILSTRIDRKLPSALRILISHTCVVSLEDTAWRCRYQSSCDSAVTNFVKLVRFRSRGSTPSILVAIRLLSRTRPCLSSVTYASGANS